MSTPTLVSLIGFISWTLFLLVMIELIRCKLVMTKKVAANGFNPQNTNLSPFMQRLSRAHANCLEGLPLVGGLMLLAIVLNQTDITDSLAYVFLAARLVQSIIHLFSISAVAVTLRFTAFAVQMLIGVYWCWQFIMVLL